MTDKIRCAWAEQHQLFIPYHDEVWGRPEHDDHTLFEMLNLEGAQAGLSWVTVLKKRESYREAFDNFDPHKIIHYDDTKIAELMGNAGIVRNRLKINAVISNARAFLEVVNKHGSFDKFIWDYVDGKPIVGHWKTFDDMPLTIPLADKMSKDLKKLDFKFVGTTIVYSFLQATGVVNDHLTNCFVYQELTGGNK